MNPYKCRIVVVDLDGTLCNSAHREHLAVAKQWDEFNAGIPDDTVHQDVADMLSLLDENNVFVYAITGRPEKHRQMTMNWLLHNKVPVDHLSMRADNDWRSDAEVKLELLNQALEENSMTKESVWFILDDRPKVVEAWRNEGFNCWQPRVGGY